MLQLDHIKIINETSVKKSNGEIIDNIASKRDESLI